MAFNTFQKHSGDTTKTLSAVIGKTGSFHQASLTFDVEIHDARQVFGRTDYFIKPVSGSGEQWVSSDRVTVN